MIFPYKYSPALNLEAARTIKGRTPSILIPLPVLHEHKRGQSKGHQFRRRGCQPDPVHVQDGGEHQHGNQHKDEGAGEGQGG